MSNYFWVVAFVNLLALLASSLSQQMDLCSASAFKFAMEHARNPILPFCQNIQHLFNNVSYRIDFTPSTVESICNDLTCLPALRLLTLPCATFVSPRCLYINLIRSRTGEERSQLSGFSRNTHFTVVPVL